jgi:hypothetical protein
MPVADPLAGDAELVGGLGLADASGEQLSGAQPAGLESFACLLGRSLAGSGSHALILPQRMTDLRPYIAFLTSRLLCSVRTTASQYGRGRGASGSSVH